MDAVLLSIAVSFGLIFVAELGDKSQLMAMTFAARYRALPVMLGISFAAVVVHGVSVAIGYGLGVSLPRDWLSLVAALAFLAFACWTLRDARSLGNEDYRTNRLARSVFFAVAGTFLVAELGDKTMIATIALGTQYPWYGVWLGATVGMIVADGLAIVIGRQLGKRLPQRKVALGAAVIFAVFGLWLLATTLVRLISG